MSEPPSPIEFWFDFASGYAYFAALEIDALAQRHGPARSARWGTDRTDPELRRAAELTGDRRIRPATLGDGGLFFLSPEVLRSLGLTDGCGFDSEGNLWVMLVTANKIVAITPAFEVVTMLEGRESRPRPRNAVESLATVNA
ncbi:MAG TPA: hypothetical protein VEC57_06135 [Candidatus Limnocylindrales bacterium]|nr:hypothetical protein [Candidatus Limnocylindrales bacterium]